MELEQAKGVVGSSKDGVEIAKLEVDKLNTEINKFFRI